MSAKSFALGFQLLLIEIMLVLGLKVFILPFFLMFTLMVFVFIGIRKFFSNLFQNLRLLSIVIKTEKVKFDR
jgi:hypothetical protein